MPHLPHTLPHFGGSQTSRIKDYVSNQLFDVKFVNVNIDTKEICDSIISLKKDKISMYINDIRYIDTLKQLNNFDIIMDLHTKNDNSTIMKIIYSNCNFKNLNKDLINFNYLGTRYEVKLKLKYDNLEIVTTNNLKNYERRQKLNRINKWME
jgi:hypothetical protein